MDISKRFIIEENVLKEVRPAYPRYHIEISAKCQLDIDNNLSYCTEDCKGCMHHKTSCKINKYVDSSMISVKFLNILSDATNSLLLELPIVKDFHVDTKQIQYYVCEILNHEVLKSEIGSLLYGDEREFIHNKVTEMEFKLMKLRFLYFNYRKTCDEKLGLLYKYRKSQLTSFVCDTYLLIEATLKKVNDRISSVNDNDEENNQ